jgi:hypothetical protein
MQALGVNESSDSSDNENDSEISVNEAVEDEDMCDEESVEDVLPDIEVYEEDESENEDDEYEEDCEFNNGFVDTPIVRYSTTPFPQRLRR